jgi:putative acyl-CoA dehydrogenase
MQPNQAPPLTDLDLFSTDPVAVRELRAALGPDDANWGEKVASEFGTLCGSAAQQEAAELANRYPPVLKQFDRHGNRIDDLEFIPRGTR